MCRLCPSPRFLLELMGPFAHPQVLLLFILLGVLPSLFPCLWPGLSSAPLSCSPLQLYFSSPLSSFTAAWMRWGVFTGQ